MRYLQTHLILGTLPTLRALPNLIIMLATLSFVHPAIGGEVTLGVAANFTHTAHELAELFEAETGHEVTASFGSTGKLYAQIRNGAPYDVFMAADTHRPLLIEQELAGVPGTRFTYARGKLVLWRPTPEGFAQAGLNASDKESARLYLSEQPFSRLAIANPKTAPYGLAAQQVLSHLGYWQDLEGKLVRGDSISQAFQFVVSRNAQSGLVALSQVTAWTGSSGDSGALWIVPQSYYQPIDQQAILLNRGSGNQAAEAWMKFLRSDDAIAIIRRHGYETGTQKAE